MGVPSSGSVLFESELMVLVRPTGAEGAHLLELVDGQLWRLATMPKAPGATAPTTTTASATAPMRFLNRLAVERQPRERMAMAVAAIAFSMSPSAALRNGSSLMTPPGTS